MVALSIPILMSKNALLDLRRFLSAMFQKSKKKF